MTDQGYDLTFSTEIQEFGVAKVRDLIPDGRNHIATNSNKADYIRLVGQEKKNRGLDTLQENKEFGGTEVRDPIPDDRNHIVTNSNKNHYIRQVCQEKMTGAIRKQLAAFLEGFYDSIPRRLTDNVNNDDENGTEVESRGSETRDFDGFSDYKDFG